MQTYKKKEFLQIAKLLNDELQIIPLLFGSFGLETKLNIDLKADDIDLLIPEEFLNEKWDLIISLMEKAGYRLYDQHEHAFEKEENTISFGFIEDLKSFARIDISKIPIINELDIHYYLPELKDFKKIYIASSKDGYRREKRGKNDIEKIKLIERMIKTKKDTSSI